MLLLTDRLILRPLEPGDAQGIFNAYASDPEATKYLVFATLTEVRQATEYIERTIRERNEGKSITWAILLKDDRRIIGALDFRINGGVGDIGYAIGKPWWGNGIVPEAAAAVLEFARTHLGTKLVTGRCDYENARSARVFEKLGFRSLGVRNDAIVHPALGPNPRPALLFERVL